MSDIYSGNFTRAKEVYIKDAPNRERRRLMEQIGPNISEEDRKIVDEFVDSWPEREKKRIELEALFERLKDFEYLPSWEELKNVMSIFRRRRVSASWETIEDKKTNARTITSRLSEIYGLQIYEILTQEFVEALANYLSETIERISKTGKKPVVILETGAGNGRLSYFLKKILEAKFPGLVEMYATDNFRDKQRGIVVTNEKISVENLDCNAALDKYEPDIVLNSWMPREYNWINDYVKRPFIKECIIIGEPAITGGWFGTMDSDKDFLFFNNDDRYTNGLNRDNAVEALDDLYEKYEWDLKHAEWFKQGFSFRTLPEVEKYQLSLAEDILRKITDGPEITGDRTGVFRRT